MLAIDTNIIVRFLTGDDPQQARRARELVEAEQVLVTATVLLESEWVLRSAYHLERDDVLQALAAFVGLPSVILKSPEQVARALEWAAAGMDFADALHLADATDCDALVTFDRRFIKAAAGRGAPMVREP